MTGHLRRAVRWVVLPAALLLAGATTDDTDLAALAAQTGKSVVRLGVFDGEEQRGNGTGFLVREDGIVVTNHHVVRDVRGEMFAVFPDGKKVAVRGSLALDKDHDLAILRIEGGGYPVLTLAESSEISVGQRALLVGSAYGLDQSVGVGIVSAVRRDGFPDDYKKQAKKRKEDIVSGPLLQHTVTAAGGASGSPIVDARGKVIGVHHSGYGDSEINFAAHVDALRALLAATDLSAAPKRVGPDVAKNLAISAAVFLGVGLIVVVAPRIGGLVGGKRKRPRSVH